MAPVYELVSDLSFGYFEDKLDIPLGPDNKIEPALGRSTV